RICARGVTRGLGVLADPEPQVQPVGAVAEVDEEVPQRKRVLPARHGYDDALAGTDHVVILDGPADLLGAVLHEVATAGRGSVPGGLRREGYGLRGIVRTSSRSPGLSSVRYTVSGDWVSARRTSARRPAVIPVTSHRRDPVRMPRRSPVRAMRMRMSIMCAAPRRCSGV